MKKGENLEATEGGLESSPGGEWRVKEERSSHRTFQAPFPGSALPL